MPLSTTADIAVPAREVWTLLTDTRAWPQWGPSIRAVESDGRLIGPGRCGRVQTAIGVWLPFQITDFIEDRYWAWRVAGIPATGHHVTPLRLHRCRLRFEVPILAAPYLAVCRVAIRRIGLMATNQGTVSTTPDEWL